MQTLVASRLWKPPLVGGPRLQLSPSTSVRVVAISILWPRSLGKSWRNHEWVKCYLIRSQRACFHFKTLCVSDSNAMSSSVWANSIGRGHRMLFTQDGPICLKQHYGFVSGVLRPPLQQGWPWVMVSGRELILPCKAKFGAISLFLEFSGPWVSGKEQRKSTVGKSHSNVEWSCKDGCSGEENFLLPWKDTAAGPEEARGVAETCGWWGWCGPGS